MLSGFLNIIILLGAIQGFISSALLRWGKPKRLSSRLLSLIIFFIALACLNLYLNGEQWFIKSGLLQLLDAVVPMVIVMPLGPLIYFYTKTLLQPDYILTKKDKRQFLLVIVDLIPYATAIVFVLLALTHLVDLRKVNIGLFIDNYNVYADIPRWASLTVYVVLSMRYISQFQRRDEAAQRSQQIKWLRRCTTVFAAFQLIWFFYLIPYVIPTYSVKLLSWVDWYPIYVPMSFLAYWLGINGYLVTQIQSKKTSQPLPDDVFMQTIRALQSAMEQDKLYLDPELSLDSLSQHTSIAPKTISAALNRNVDKTFNEFVNGYRIADFKERFTDPNNSHLTIAGIASECGFNSQATFQRTFRQFTGLSPSEYKAQSSQGT
jgi:AraC-like DNA-binding protein